VAASGSFNLDDRPPDQFPISKSPQGTDEFPAPGESLLTEPDFSFTQGG
jgi:hypothetical protein